MLTTRARRLCETSRIDCVQVLRGLLHPAALPWLRDPYDLEDESFRELWAAPLGAQLAGSARSFAVVAAATVAAVHLPVRAAAPAAAKDGCRLLRAQRAAPGCAGGSARVRRSLQERSCGSVHADAGRAESACLRAC